MAMASEPNKDMDQLLRAYAQQRRQQAGPPFDLHPVTRRLLVAEATRPAAPAPPARAPWAAWLRRFMPHLVFATLVVTVVASLVWISIPKGSSPAPLAKISTRPTSLIPREQPIQDEHAKYKAVQSPSAAAPAKKESAVDQDILQTKAPVALTVNAPEPMPSTPPVRMSRDMVADAAFPRPAPIASPLPAEPPPAAPIATAPAASPTATAADALYAGAMPAPSNPAVAGTAPSPPSSPPDWRQRFQRSTLADTDKAQDAAPASLLAVLQSFEIQRTGSHLRIIDADGSVYEGELVSGDAMGGSRTYQMASRAAPLQNRSLSGPLLKQQPILEKAQPAQAARELRELTAFRASGTNRTLNLPISIEAAFASAPQEVQNVPAFGGMAAPRPPGGLVNARPDSRPAPSFTPATPSPSISNPPGPAQSLILLAPAGLHGLVRIGSTNQLPIDARAAP